MALLYKNCPEIGKDAEPFFREAIQASKSNADLQQYHPTNLYGLGSFLDEAKRFDDADAVFCKLLPLIKPKSEHHQSDNS
jgi:hypothetical protein